ncbi:pilin [Paludibacterium paludis]|uniref:Prepilin-type N-terminal cleavage/methylation domain-containing protein n=1 Tax=Paludibacterium paludis TaxID=1225769 RepID=A0A918U933_9NEIS|nr:pilin [Paludibacterium paludis]GGY10101.1 prepilin-type N-terminal cleavage/methylation domain-containing protein [Paludibacterium paludis]
MQHRAQRGFTLIELMIVVAIVGILATLAVPRYLDYTRRARVAEALTLMAGAKTRVSEAIITNNVMPATAALVLPAVSTDNVSDVSYALANGNGFITATLTPAVAPANTNAISLRATLNNGNLTWACVNGNSAGQNGVPAEILPSSCVQPAAAPANP